MRLGAAEFNRRLETGSLRLALIGMSNIGKSHWSRQLRERYGFSCFEVDEAIQKKLSVETIADSAKWMGHPYDERYAARAAQYMQLEADLTLSPPPATGNFVLDTTGSVIHLSAAALAELKRSYLIVGLRAGADDLRRLVRRFSSDPKPLIWGPYFRARAGQSDKENLMTSYPALLEARSGLYNSLADIMISTERLEQAGESCDFLDIVHQQVTEHSKIAG